MGKQTTYQKLLAAYNKLLMENEFLHKEVDRLQALLNSKDIHITQPITKQHLSLEEKVSVFRNLFKGREDVFARRWYSRTSGKSGYQPVSRPPARSTKSYFSISIFIHGENETFPLEKHPEPPVTLV